MKARVSGLTLAETLVSLTVLILVMLSVLNLFPSSMSILRGTRSAWLARAAAQDKVETLASQPFATIALGLDETSDLTLSDNSQCHLHTTVSAVNGHSPTHLKRIRCEATWQGRAGQKSAVQEVYVHSVRR